MIQATPTGLKKQEALARLQANALHEAKACLIEVCKSDTDDADAWFWLAEVNGRLGLSAEAEVCSRRAIALEPRHANAHVALGLALEYQGKLHDAALSLQRGIELDPRHEIAVEHFARIDLRLSANNTITLNVAGGIEICLPGSLQLMSPYILLEQEDWFEDEIRFVRSLARPGMQAVDIGANYGVYTLMMAKRAAPHGVIWAFEPATGTAAFLRQSIQRNRFDNVRLFQSALSDHCATGHLSLGKNSELNALRAQPDAKGLSEPVSLVTLDECERKHDWRDIEFIKLDAEGEEANIINGGRNFLRARSPLIMYEIRKDGSFNHSLADQFRSLDYMSYRLVPGLGILAKLDPAETLERFQLNLFCCKQDRAASLEERGLLALATGDALPIFAPEDAIWRVRLGTLKYAEALVPDWIARAGSDPGWAMYQSAINYYFLAHDELSAPAVRLARLDTAYKVLLEALSMHRNIPRLHTCARIAWELGKRNEAFRILSSLRQQPGDDASVYRAEPFLAVAGRFEQIPTGADVMRWARATVLEQWLRLQSYSSYFVGRQSLADLEQLRELGWQSTEMERRWQLIRMSHGMQSQPQPGVQLAVHSAENLNPDYWCSGRA